MLRLPALAAVLLFASTAFAQGMPPGHGAGAGTSQQPSIPADQQQALMMAQMQLVQAQQKAMQDPVILAERDKVRAIIEKEMLKADPTIKPKLKRFKELEVEAKQMQAQQAAGTLDPAKAQAFMKEMGEIGPALEKAQMAVMEKPAVKKQTAAFEKRLEAKMLEIDPGVGKAKTLVESFNPNKR